MRSRRLIRFFQENATTHFEDYFSDDSLTYDAKQNILERCIASLESIRLREEFSVHYKHFMHSMNVLIPHQNATPYIGLMHVLGYIHAKARERYSDQSMHHLYGAGNKVKALIHEHLESRDVIQRGEPLDLLSDAFEEEMERQSSPDAKASYMKHKMRHHIQTHHDENPALYEEMSEKLERIIQEYEHDSEEQLDALRALSEQFTQAEDETMHGLTPTEMKYYRLLHRAIEETGRSLNHDEEERLASLTREWASIIDEHTQFVGFWDTPSRQTELTAKLQRKMMNVYTDFVELYRQKQELASTLVKIAKANR